MTHWPQLEHSTTPLTACAIELAGRVRGALVSDEQRVRVGRICDLARVEVRVRPLQIGERRHAAMLVPVQDGFRAVVDSGLWRSAANDDARLRRRMRFVLSHELGHTFFYTPGRPPRRAHAPDRREESFCQRFATSLLVPPSIARETPADIGGLAGLAERYDVSLQVAAWAAVRARSDLSVLLLRWGPHPRRTDEPAMRVTWGASESFIARGESFKSPLAHLGAGETGECVQRLRLGGRWHDVHARAWRTGTAMLVVLHHQDSPVPAGPESGGGRQLPLFP